MVPHSGSGKDVKQASAIVGDEIQPHGCLWAEASVKSNYEILAVSGLSGGWRMLLAASW